MSNRKWLVLAGAGILVYFLLTSDANAMTIGPSNAGGPGPTVREADEAEVRQVPVEPAFGRGSDPAFGTGSAQRGTATAPLSSGDVPSYLENPDIAYLYGDR